MLTEGPPEAFIEPYTFLPERSLAFVCRGRKGYRVLHKGAVLPELCAWDLGEESETTGGNPPRLLADEPVVFATAADPHAGQPGVHRPAEPDFWISGSNCFRLEIQEDQSGYGTVGDANPSPLPCSAGLHQ